jgi:hypothetical protein
MKTLLALALGTAAVAQAIAGSSATLSPKQVVEEFVKLDTDGTRLTPQGWGDSNKFFLHPEPFSTKLTISVVSNEIDVSEKPADAAEATCVVFAHDLYGRIGPNLDFTPTPGYASNGAPVLRGSISTYHLALIGDSRSQGDPQPAEWKIEDFQRIILLNLSTAIRYAQQARDRTTDPSVKKNADETVAALTKLR